MKLLIVALLLACVLGLAAPEPKAKEAAPKKEEIAPDHLPEYCTVQGCRNEAIKGCKEIGAKELGCRLQRTLACYAECHINQDGSSNKTDARLPRAERCLARANSNLKLATQLFALRDEVALKALEESGESRKKTTHPPITQFNPFTDPLMTKKPKKHVKDTVNALTEDGLQNPHYEEPTKKKTTAAPVKFKDVKSETKGDHKKFRAEMARQAAARKRHAAREKVRRARRKAEWSRKAREAAAKHAGNLVLQLEEELRQVQGQVGDCQGKKECLADLKEVIEAVKRRLSRAKARARMSRIGRAISGLFRRRRRSRRRRRRRRRVRRRQRRRRSRRYRRRRNVRVARRNVRVVHRHVRNHRSKHRMRGGGGGRARNRRMQLH